MKPSPHEVAVHAAPAVAHVQPASSAQLDEQPSLLFVLPSSQSSAPATRPSPHAVATQGEPATAHVQPDTSAQLDEQPSLFAVFPSSHVSVPARIESPQVVEQALGEPAQ